MTLNDGNGNAPAAPGFQANQSSTWNSTGDYQLMTESFLGITSDGKYGLDAVGLGVEAATGLTSSQNIVAGVSTEPFYLGQVGLKPSNTTNVNGTASFMAQLKNENLVPSLSYGYTAGALYCKPQSLCIEVIKLRLSSRPRAKVGKPHARGLRFLALCANYSELSTRWQ